MGLHVDVRRIYEDNKQKEGVRKYVGVLINQEDKLTKEQKRLKQLHNKAKYGLPRDFYSQIVLPPPTELKVFRWDDVMNHRKNLTTIDRISMLGEIEKHLLFKIQQLQNQPPSQQNGASRTPTRQVFDY